MKYLSFFQISCTFYYSGARHLSDFNRKRVHGALRAHHVAAIGLFYTDNNTYSILCRQRCFNGPSWTPSSVDHLQPRLRRCARRLRWSCLLGGRNFIHQLLLAIIPQRAVHLLVLSRSRPHFLVPSLGTCCRTRSRLVGEHCRLHPLGSDVFSGPGKVTYSIG